MLMSRRMNLGLMASMAVAMFAGGPALGGWARPSATPSATIGTSRERLSATGKRKGITVAQAKRAATKARNVKRHKAATRRKS